MGGKLTVLTPASVKGDVSAMRTSTFHFLEGMLRDYPRTDKIIADYEEDLRAPFRDGRDENVGGGRMQNNRDDRVENMAITIASDRTLRNLRLYHETIARVLACSDSDTCATIDLLYFKQRKINMSGVAMQLSVSRSVVSRKRTAFFNELGCQLGFWC